MLNKRLGSSFYCRDVLEVAPDLVGKKIVIRNSKGFLRRSLITETEAYRGEDDLACHASRGRTKRTEVMYHEGGLIYMYMIYGIHWMFNVVTSVEGVPQAVLLRGLGDIEGPGRITRVLGLDGSFYGKSLVSSGDIWIEDTGFSPVIKEFSRIGIDYAGRPWTDKLWRYRAEKW